MEWLGGWKPVTEHDHHCAASAREALKPLPTLKASKQTRKQTQSQIQSEGPAIKAQRHQRWIGKPLVPKEQSTFLDHVRRFDVEHKTAGKVLAVAGILAVSATVAYLLDLAVDELAHLTERKNDKVGMLVGTIVGMLMATSHLSQLFAVPRRLEMRMKARDWWEDGLLPESQSRKFLEEHALPLHMALISNAKAIVGVPHKDLRIMHCDMVDTLNYISKHNIPSEKWKNYMVEYDGPPRYGQAYVRADHSFEHLGIKKGKYYVSKFPSANSILQRDLQNSFDSPLTRMNTFLGGLRTMMPVVGKASAETSEQWKTRILEQAPPAVQDALLTKNKELEPIAEQVRAFLEVHKEPRSVKNPAGVNNVKPGAENNTSTENSDGAKSTQGEQGAKPNNGVTETREGDFKTIPDRDDNYLEQVNPHLYSDLATFFEKKFPGEHNAVRTWIRVDELEKVGLLLSGLRPPTLHTMFRNYMDSFIDGVASGANPSVQARNAGTAFPGYVPMLGIGSVVTVLGLGLSSSSPPPSVTSESGQKVSNSNTSSTIDNSMLAMPGGGPVAEAPQRTQAGRGQGGEQPIA